MAFSVSVKCLPGREASEYWHVDRVPWNLPHHDLRLRLVPVDESGAYRDYYAVLTTQEALALNAPVLADGLPHHREKAALLHDLLVNQTPGGLVVVSVYEWESGMGD